MDLQFLIGLYRNYYRVLLLLLLTSADDLVVSGCLVGAVGFDGVSGLFAPRYFRSSERKFPVGTFAPRNPGTFASGKKGSRNFRSRERMFPGTFIPGMLSDHGKGGLGNFRSPVFSLLGTKVPGNFRYLERKFRGTFAPGSDILGSELYE